MEDIEDMAVVAFITNRDNDGIVLQTAANYLTPQVGIAKTRSNVGDLSVYPNPFSESLAISLPAGGSIQAELFDTAGRMVFHHMSEDGAVLWHTGHLPSGTYLVRLETDSGVEVRKVSLIR